MKKIFKTLASLVLITVLTININISKAWWVEPNSLETISAYWDGNPYVSSYTDDAGVYHPGNCTWYVWGRAHHRLGIKLPGWSAPANWCNDAGNSGYSVGTTPRTNSIIVWQYHVAYVESWDGTNLQISECNWWIDVNQNNRDYYERTCNDYYNGPGGVGSFIGFIYLENSDTEKPVINSAYVSFSDMTSNSYKVIVKASDNVGVTAVKFPTWPRIQSGNDAIWHEGTYNSSLGQWECTIKKSDYNISDIYYTHVYVYDAAGNVSSYALDCIPIGSTVADLGDEFIARIAAKENTNVVLGIDGTTPADPVQTEIKNLNDDTQLWKFKRNSNKSYTITNISTGLCFDIANAKNDNGTPIQLCSANGSNAQQIYIMNYNGGYRLSAECSNNIKGVDFASSSYTTGNQVYIKTPEGLNDNRQTVVIEKVEETGIKGDINKDGEINARDAKLAIQHFTGKIELTDEQILRADVNFDGNINARDAKLAIQHFTGKIELNNNSNNTANKEYLEGYEIVGKIQIPKTNVDLPVLSESSVGALEHSVGIFYGVGLNNIGNTTIMGHNYRNETFFSNNKQLTIGDVIYITDKTNNIITYEIYKIDELETSDVSYISRDTNGLREITLTTTTDDMKNRLIIFAKEN